MLWVFVLCSVVWCAPRPHIIHILADDLGWWDIGYHRDTPTKDLQSPFIDGLVKTGIELDRHYNHKICSPSRCAFQTGRAPIHVNVQNVEPNVRNPKDPVGGYQGIPVNMTGVANHLKSAGYKTHAVGKWDVGMATPSHVPAGRGYDTWLGYYHHTNDYWSHDVDTCKTTEKMKDLWRYEGPSKSAPAVDLENGKHCGQDHQDPAGETCVFEESVLTSRVKEVITNHNTSEPLFLFWAMHLVHMPLQVTKEYVDKFSFIEDPFRRMLHAMVLYMDDDVKSVISLLRDRGMWNNTLVTFEADNGGEILAAGVCGGNNWPLRGGKFANWEGGVRTNAFVTGGVIPEKRRGTKEEGYITGWDWYATYCALAGVDPTDHRAAAAGLPPIDSLNMWPLLSGTVTDSPRTEIPLGDTAALSPNGDGQALVGGLIQGDYKLVLGAANKDFVILQDTRTAPIWPNITSTLIPLLHSRRCTRDPKVGCLFNIRKDPYELNNIAESEAAVFARLLARIDALQATVYSPDRGPVDPLACKVANEKYGGYWGPWVGV